MQRSIPELVRGIDVSPRVQKQYPGRGVVLHGGAMQRGGVAAITCVHLRASFQKQLYGLRTCLQCGACQCRVEGGRPSCVVRVGVYTDSKQQRYDPIAAALCRGTQLIPQLRGGSGVWAVVRDWGRQR